MTYTDELLERIANRANVVRDELDRLNAAQAALLDNEVPANPSDDHHPPMLTVQEVAERYGVSTAVILHRARNGNLPSYRILERYRFVENELPERLSDRRRAG
jgi:excisionase family DNA binding protein